MSHSPAAKRPGGPPKMEAPDMHEVGGPKEGAPQKLDRRLFINVQAFGNCTDTQPLIDALKSSALGGVLYADANDSRGVALVTYSEDPNHFVGPVRELLSRPPFNTLEQKPEYAMLGRTYALGYEPDLVDWLIEKPKRRLTDPEWPWAVWYPLKRKGEFMTLPEDEQKKILREHGTIGLAFGQAGLALDVRLACHGLDKNDNDFVIGLLGKDLHRLSAVVERMRKTRQTSTLMENMGPFFVGKAIWQSTGA
jgi:hypothetical protein